MPKGRGRQRKRVRRRAWDEQTGEDAASREARRMRGRETGVDEPAARDLDLDACFSEVEANGLVVSPYGVLAFVRVDGRERLCRVADALTDGRRSVLAPGDAVRVENLQDDEPRVSAVRHRRSRLSRPGVGRMREQVFAANVDLLVAVTAAAKPRPKPGLLDRYLIAADLGGVDSIICVNKMDLVQDEPALITEFRDVGVPVIDTSCEDGRGLEDLRAALADKMAVFCGQSGVGKSSLLRALQPGLDIEVAAVSDATEKGRHTTTSARLYDLPGGVRVIDTPGIRQLAVWGVEPEELDAYFPEIAERAAECRFRDCVHGEEPGCAVREAVEAGAISPRRHRSYQRIRETLEQRRAW
jgi:ribosome biogenesis GTPase